MTRIMKNAESGNRFFRGGSFMHKVSFMRGASFMRRASSMRTLGGVALMIIVFSGIGSFAESSSYVVRPGDTLWNIAAREMGDGRRWLDIAQANQLQEPYKIEIGQVLAIPDSASRTTPGSAPRTTPDSAPRTTTPPSPIPPIPSMPARPPMPKPSASTEVSPASEASLSFSAADSSTVSDTAALALPTLPRTIVALPSFQTDATIVSPSSVSSDALTQPLLLEDAVSLGLKRAPEIAGAVAAVRRARADHGVAWSGALPQVSATGDARRTETFKSTSTLGVDEYSAGGGVTITQALFSFGRLSSALKSASAQEAASLASLAAAKSRVRFRVETAFLSLLLQKIREEVARDAVEAAAELERRARVREAGGAGTLFDSARARAERASREARHAAAAAGIETSREELAVAMGFAPGTSLDIDGDLFAAPLPVPAAEAVRIGMTERPDLAALSYSVKSGEALIDYERAQGNPSLGATASFSYTRHDYITASPFFKGQDASSGFIGIGVTIPLFDGFRVRERVRSQTASVDELKSRQDRARLDAEREIRAVYFDLGAAQKAIAARRAGVSAAREALRMAQVSFEAGRATALDVIQASAALAEAAGAEAESAYSFRFGLARLIAATGTDAVMEKML